MLISYVEKVERHIRRLDDDLIKFEEEQMTGPKLLSSRPEPKYYNSDIRDQRSNYSSSTAARPRRGTCLYITP